MTTIGTFSATPILLNADSNKIYVGQNGTGGGYFNGTIDEIMIFNRELSDYEIDKLYSVGSDWAGGWGAPDYDADFTNLGGVNHSYRFFVANQFGNFNESTNRTINATLVVSDTTAPIVNLINPINVSNYSAVPINFNISTSENASAIFTLTNGLTNYTMTSINSTYHGATNGTIADGRYFVKFFANDSNSNYNNTVSSAFLIDSVVPLVFYGTSTETDASTVTRDNIFVNSSASDGTARVKNITIRLYNATALVNTSESDLSSFSMNFTGLSNGLYYFNSTSCDYSFNCNNTETRTTSVDTDTTIPIVNLINPQNGSNLNSLPVNFNITSNENASARFTLTNGLTNYTMTSINTTYHGAINNSIADGEYLIKFFVNDSSDNYNNTVSSAFLIDTI